MMLCKKVSDPCTEEEADKFECEHVGFYGGAGDIHGLCFFSGDTADMPCNKQTEVKGDNN